VSFLQGVDKKCEGSIYGAKMKKAGPMQGGCARKGPLKNLRYNLLEKLI